FSELQLDRNFRPLTLEQMKGLEPLAFERAGI
ncbi:MAG: phage head morphosis protein, partial [Pseudomonas sp.]|nr:phage head morphosis protein [Pseudomonas sp.]